MYSIVNLPYMCACNVKLYYSSKAYSIYTTYTGQRTTDAKSPNVSSGNQTFATSPRGDGEKIENDKKCKYLKYFILLLLFAYNFPSYKTTVFYVVYMYKDFITH